ncbi:MAG: universal stress protein [Nitrosopumilaceae archaeon]|jgi:nucleotide-binding universal stress UspA family protein
MFFKNIFVPFDGSTHSIRALKAALHIAEKYDSKITVAYCIQRPLLAKDLPKGGKFVISINKVMKKQAMIILSQAQQIAIQNNFKINNCILESDSVVKKLVSFTKGAKMDSVIMGTRGTTRAKGSFLGSVANGLSHRVHCPVLLVR